MSNGVVTVAVDAFVMVVDGSGVVVQWSRQAEKLVGCAAEEGVGRPVAHLVTRVMAGGCGDRGAAGAVRPPPPAARGDPALGASVAVRPPPGASVGGVGTLAGRGAVC